MHYWGFGDVIAPGACISFVASVRTPGWTYTIGNAYWLGAYADVEMDLWESDETNNGRADEQITIEGPDLVMTAMSAPSSVGTETPFDVSSTVANVGMGASYGFDVAFYLSPDPIVTRQDRSLDAYRIGFMWAGGSETTTVALAIPSDVPAGTHYLGAIVDPYDFLTESDEGNNVFTQTIDVLGPDLVMAEVSAPAAARTGETIIVHDVVTAQATGGSASNVEVGLYLSSDPVIATSDTRLATRYVTGLVAGTSSAADTAITIPTTFAGGTYYVGAIADPWSHVTETDESNNALAGGTFTLTGPDLVVTAASGPSSGATGGTVVVENTVAASATGGLAPEFYVGILLSTDPIITASDTVLGWRHVQGLSPGATSTDATAVTLPTGLAPGGTYYLGVIADDFWAGGCDEWETCWEMQDNAKESDETNNALLAGPIAVAGPDVTPTEVSAPATGATGQPLVVRNTASATGGASGVFQVALYLSADQVITTSDRWVGMRYVYGLPPDGSSTEDTAVTVPATVVPGTYYVGAIADSSNAVVESNESNNALAGNAVSIGGADLTVTGVSGPENIATSASFPVTTTAVNAGEGSSPASNVSIYLSADAVITTSDLRLGYRTVPGLAPDASSTSATSVSIPGSVVPGTYYLGAIADPSNGVKESDEGNNVLIGGTIAVTGPDLFVTAAAAPATGLTGGTIVVDQTIAAGPDGGATWVTVGIYLSTDLVVTTSDVYLGLRGVNNLAAGASSAASTSVTIPATLAGGTYYVGVLVDPWRSIAESDEANNDLVAGTIAITGPDLVATALSGPTTAASGGTVTVADTVVASAAGGAAPEFYVGYFLSADPLITEGDRWIGSRYVSGLGPGASTAASTLVTIPADLAPGTYYLGMIVDDFWTYIGDEWDGYYVYDNAKESDEGNNALSGGTIAVTVP
jgi:subtilase family serine protease